VDKNHATGSFACPAYKANTKGANSHHNDAKTNKHHLAQRQPCAAVQNLLTQTAKERNAGVVLLSEPYLPCVGNPGVLLDESGKAAIKCKC